MTYTFRAGFRLVVPFIDKLEYRVKGSWVGRETKEASLLMLGFCLYSLDPKQKGLLRLPHRKCSMTWLTLMEHYFLTPSPIGEDLVM